jgi:hypothetical protein
MASPSIARGNILTGPGTLLYGTGPTLFSQENIEASCNPETWRPQISTHGQGAPRISDAIAEITFTPAGQISADLLTLLFPAAFRNPSVGSRVFPASDTALLVHGIDGSKLTFPNAALTKMPDLVLSPKATAFGQAAFTALVKDNTARTATGAFFSSTTGAWSETFDEGLVVAVPYAGAWNSIDIPTEDGWRVSFEVQTEPIYVAGIGTVDYRITGVTARASCVPVGISASALLTQLRPEGLALGSTLRQSEDLVITGEVGGLLVTLKDAALLTGGSRWGASVLRSNEIGFEASREFSGESPNTTLGAVFDIAIATEPEPEA